MKHVEVLGRNQRVSASDPRGPRPLPPNHRPATLTPPDVRRAKNAAESEAARRQQEANERARAEYRENCAAAIQDFVSSAKQAGIAPGRIRGLRKRAWLLILNDGSGEPLYAHIAIFEDGSWMRGWLKKEWTAIRLKPVEKFVAEDGAVLSDAVPFGYHRLQPSLVDYLSRRLKDSTN